MFMLLFPAAGIFSFTYIYGAILDRPAKECLLAGAVLTMVIYAQMVEALL